MMENYEQRLGRFVEMGVGGERVRAYVPKPLPPDPPLDLLSLMSIYERAIAAVGRLDGVATVLPSTPFFLYMYVRKEALLSSQIEGTQSTLSDLLLYESDEEPTVELDDVTEVSNYVAAVSHGVDRLRGGFPLTQTDPRDAWDPSEFRSWCAPNTWRVPTLSELDWRYKAW